MPLLVLQLVVEREEADSKVDLDGQEDHLGGDHLGEDHLSEDHLGEDYLGEDHLGQDYLGV